MINSDSDIDKKDNDFGSVLAEAREAQNYTVDEINSHLKIPAYIISAIEANDTAALPEPAYTQGYIRAYARFLEIPEDSVLEIYNRAVPHNLTSELNYRSASKNNNKADLPSLKNLVTVVLAVAGVSAVFYGGYQYYTEKADDMDNELDSKQGSFTGNSLDSPGIRVEQNARLTEEGELIVQTENTADLINEEAADVKPAANEGGIAVESETGNEVDLQAAETAKQLDTIKFVAEEGSWMEVRDANNERLFYNMVPVGGEKVLQGQAPFIIVLGNAGTTKVVINDLEVDMSAYIRSNNTAKFKVSSENDNVVFH
jgi:cytoskeleton protein RodZ